MLVALARETDELGAAPVARQFTLRGPDRSSERIAAGDEVLAIAESHCDDDLRFRAHQWLVSDNFQAGNLVSADAATAALDGIAERRRDPIGQWWVLVFRGLLAGFAARRTL